MSLSRAQSTALRTWANGGLMVRSLVLATGAVLALATAVHAQEPSGGDIAQAVSSVSVLSVFRFPANLAKGLGPADGVTLRGGSYVGASPLGGSCARMIYGCGVVYQAPPPADGQTLW